MRRNILRFAFPVGVALAAACSSSSSSAPGGFQPVSGSGSNNGASSGAGASASSGTGTTGSSTGGIACGSQTCTSSQVCCFGSTPMPGMGTCMDPSACTGSSLACSATSACSNSQVCCFTYNPSTSTASATADDSGALGAGFGGFGGGTATTGPGVPFTAACQDSCPAGTSYQLCDVSSTTDCPSGDTCTTYMATYTPYCAAGGGGLPGLGDGGFGGGFPTGGNPFGDAGFGLTPPMGTADADVGEAGPDE
jgi:hypothetical protein